MRLYFGDGFYGQRLTRKQVAQLTGQRFLANYSNDEQQYKALMDASVAFRAGNDLNAKAANLGVSYSAAGWNCNYQQLPYNDGFA